MNEVRIDPGGNLIVLQVRVAGPERESSMRLALDTGATRTLIDASLLESIGCVTEVGQRMAMITGSSVEYVSTIQTNEIEVLGVVRRGFPVIAHTLPAGARIDGLLGLDFLRDCRVMIDFREGRLTLD